MCVTLSVVLPRALDAGAQARRSIERWLAPGDVEDRLLQDLRIVASELVNNAVVHGEGRIVLEITRDAGAIRVRVTDDGTRETPAIRKRHGAETGGWGLRIVDHLAAGWGVGSGLVWAELAIPPSPPPVLA